MEDYLVSATAFDGTIDIIAANTTGISKTARRYHNLSDISDVIFSKVMTASVIMSNFIKGDKESLMLEVNSSGECGKVISIVNSNLEVRGYIDNNNLEIKRNEQIEDKIGVNGYVKVIKDMGLKEPYIGISKMNTGDISKDLMYYYIMSEQIPSYVELSHIRDDGVSRDCGMMIQVMPDATDRTIRYIKENIERFNLFNGKAKEGNTLEDILIYIFKGEELNIKERRMCEYRCNCSRERSKRGLVSLGKKEIEDILKEDDRATVECHFCNRKYEFSKEDLLRIIEDEQ